MGIIRREVRALTNRRQLAGLLMISTSQSKRPRHFLPLPSQTILFDVEIDILPFNSCPFIEHQNRTHRHSFCSGRAVTEAVSHSALPADLLPCVPIAKPSSTSAVRRCPQCTQHSTLGDYKIHSGIHRPGRSRRSKFSTPWDKVASFREGDVQKSCLISK
jgi:hypothetical protein